MSNFMIKAAASNFLPWAKRKMTDSKLEVAIGKKDENTAQLQIFIDGRPSTAFNVPFDKRIEGAKLVDFMQQLMTDEL